MALRSKPRLLDLFCGAGGASMGYHRAGFTVIGIDTKPQPHYPFEFIQCDWEEALEGYPHLDFDAIHASPPCQAYSLAASGRRRLNHPDLIAPVRQRLLQIGLPWIIENVPQAPLLSPITLCGTSFGLPILRHRSFGLSFALPHWPKCHYSPTARVRHAGYHAYPYARKTWTPAWKKFVLPTVWPWMTVRESGQAIPPPTPNGLASS